MESILKFIKEYTLEKNLTNVQIVESHSLLASILKFTKEYTLERNLTNVHIVIFGTLENGNLDFCFVDFGNNGGCPLKDLRALCCDFLGLPFQAIKFSLAQIAPSGEQWEEEALDEFERLTHFGELKPLLAKISSYVRTGNSTWPKIHSYDTNNGKKLDTGLELVCKGYAVDVPEDVEEDGTVPYVLKDMVTETDTSFASILIETKKSPEETAHTLSCLSLSEETT
ncbi:Tudor and KH domain-containing protein [Cricetulus griseus]|uniref:Tudor and KH domain-containing protein n=1 Tax=Cricetulus griseus TaxID=10029 RepID=G3IFT8_CRIGR|nr:Tudor and KH domain-containing protein [Cricetulus griseus]